MFILYELGLRDGTRRSGFSFCTNRKQNNLLSGTHNVGYIQNFRYSVEPFVIFQIQNSELPCLTNFTVADVLSVLAYHYPTSVV